MVHADSLHVVGKRPDWLDPDTRNVAFTGRANVIIVRLARPLPEI